MVTKRWNPVNRLHDVPSKVPGMAGRKANAPDARHLPHGGQQFGEAALPFRVPVAVHVLAQKLNLGVTLVGNPPRLVQHRPRASAALLAARVRHNAVGAELVAPLNDGDVAAVRILPRRKLRLEGLVRLPVVQAGDSPLARLQPRQHLRQFAV